MARSWKKLMATASTPLLVATLAGCGGGSLGGSPTPDAWRPPPTATIAASPTAAAPTAEAAVRKTVSVELGSLPDRLTLSGQVAPVLERELAFRQEGVLRTLYVEPGMSVKAGQLLAELDLGTLQEQLSRAREVATQDNVALRRAGETATINVRSAEIALEAAQSALAQLKTPPRATELAKARAAVAQAEAALAQTRNDASAVKSRAEQALKNAVDKLTALQGVYGDVSARNQRNPTGELGKQLADLEPQLREAENAMALAQIDLDTAKGNEIAAVQAAEATLSLARATLQDLVSGPDSFTIAAAERAVRQAQIALDAANQAAGPDPALTKVLASSQLDMKEIESQIETRRIYAPFDGTITSVDALASFPVQAEVPVIRIMDGSGLQVTAAGIAETDLARFAVGSPVTLSFARYPKRPISGTVQRPATGYSASGGAPTLHVAYDAPADMPVTIGDPVSVGADFGVRDGVLVLPTAAIRRDGGTYVLILNGEEERRVDVTLGITTEDLVEIVAGLAEHDVVVLP